MIDAGESATLLTLERPSNLSNDHVNAYIARFNRFSTGGMTAEEQTAIIEAGNALKDKAEFLEASGWETTYDGFTRALPLSPKCVL
jgi:hypothetical protein